MPYRVKNVDLRIENPKDFSNIQSLIKLVRPDWSVEKLQIKVFNEGTSNVLFAVSIEQPLTPNNCVLLRIFGFQTELYIDRDREAVYLWILNQLNFASEVFARFRNGICYGYLSGSTVTYDMLSKPKYFKLVAEKVAALHSLPIDDFAKQHISDVGFLFDTSPCVLNQALKFIGLISDNLLQNPVNSIDNNANHSVPKNALPTKEYLIEEVLYLRKLLSTAKSPVKFCHNDLLFGNIIFSSEKQSIHFIDFEYCGYNHVCYDIANHFCEYTGMAEYKSSRYPSRELQREWVETYLHAFKKLSDLSPVGATYTNASNEVDAWLEEIQRFTLASHLYWGIWSIVQSQRSKIAFDYTKYALIRLDEYKKMKAALLT